MDARNRLLGEWLRRIDTRQIVLPRFQRFEAWGPQEISDLLLTVIRSLPAGSALVLEIGDTVPFKYRSIEGAPVDGERVAELLLDGQQRLTALWKSLNDKYDDRKYFVDLNHDDEAVEGEESPQIRTVSRYIKTDRLFPLWADTPEQCWERVLLPVSLLRPGDDAAKEMQQWAKRAAQGDADRTLDIIEFITPMRERVAQFNLPYLALPTGTSKETVIDVFVKLNTRTVKLTAFDIVVAEVEQVAGESLHDLVRGLKGTVPAIEAYIDPSDLVLTASSLLQDRPPNRTGYMNLDFDKMVEHWPLLVTGVQETVRFLEQERILDGQRLPTSSILAPLVALWARAPKNLDARGNAYLLLKKYTWRAFFTDRYEKAAASAALQDFRSLLKVLTGETSDSRSVPIFDEADFPVADIEQISQASWPKKRDRLARAVLLTSLLRGAKDIADNSEATREHLKQREYHHLFPRAYLQHNGYDDDMADRALNCALVTWKTNRAIAAKEPLDYLLEHCKASTLGEQEIRFRLDTHGISYDGMIEGNYDRFLQNRAETVHKVATELCAGKAIQ